MVDNSYPVAKKLSRATCSIFIGLASYITTVGWYSGWLDDWLTGWLGGKTKRNQWLLYSQRGLRSAQRKACVTSGWLVSSSGFHWITVKYHMGAFGPCDWPYGNLGSSWGIFTASTITGDASRCSLVCSECSSKLLEHMLIYLASDWVILLELLIPGDGNSSSSNLIKAQVR